MNKRPIQKVRIKNFKSYSVELATALLTQDKLSKKHKLLINEFFKYLKDNI